MSCEVFSPGPCSPPARKLARFARCGRFAAAAAAARPQAISTNMIVFVVRGLTFVNVIALAKKVQAQASWGPEGFLD